MSLREHRGYSTPGKTIDLLPEILEDLKRVLPSHPAGAYLEDLHRRVCDVYVELEALDDLTYAMACACRNNNYDYCDFGGIDASPGSWLRPYLDKVKIKDKPVIEEPAPDGSTA